MTLMRCRRNASGMVTAEAALVLPLVAAFALAMVYLVSLAVAEVSTVDAARDAARALARGDDSTHAIDQARATAPAGAKVTVERNGDEVSVRVVVEAGGPGWFVVPLPTMTLESKATVVAEDGSGLG
jgi:hypothetical protein